MSKLIESIDKLIELQEQKLKLLKDHRVGLIQYLEQNKGVSESHALNQ